jgi:hypothetical protein
VEHDSGGMRAVLRRSHWGAAFRIFKACFALAVALLAAPLRAPAAKATSQEQAGYFRLRLRTRVRPFKASDVWQETYFQQRFNARQTAIVICDMWNKHWCAGATRRVNLLAKKMEPVLECAREAGILIVHSPSDTMSFYKDYPQRLAMLKLAVIRPPHSLGLTDPPLPIDDSDGGCDTPGDHEHQVWTRENPLIGIAPQDVISDNGEQVYTFIHQRGVQAIFYMGVHVNMCILNRTFAIKQMTNWGMHCVLLRDLTDSMYNPKDRPYVSHAEGTELVVEHIEQYWCPTATSADLVQALKSSERDSP